MNLESINSDLAMVYLNKIVDYTIALTPKIIGAILVLWI
jgi:hypothetical protein